MIENQWPDAAGKQDGTRLSSLELANCCRQERCEITESVSENRQTPRCLEEETGTLAPRIPRNPLSRFFVRPAAISGRRHAHGRPKIHRQALVTLKSTALGDGRHWQIVGCQQVFSPLDPLMHDHFMG